MTFGGTPSRGLGKPHWRWGDSTDPCRAVGAPSETEPHERRIAARKITVAGGHDRPIPHGPLASQAMTAIDPADPQLIDDVEPCANETLDRFLTGTVTVVP